MTLLGRSLLLALTLTSVGVGGANRRNGGERTQREEQGRRTIPGRPGVDYPTFRAIPKTGFSCLGKSEGFYLDPDPKTRCQLFHICSLRGGSTIQQSFLCPNGTVFNKRANTCDWWNNVHCENSRSQHSPSVEGILDTVAPLRGSKPVDYVKSPININIETLNTVESRNPRLINNIKVSVDKTEVTSDSVKNNPSKTIHHAKPTGNFLGKSKSGNSPVSEVSIKPRVHYTHSLKNTSDNPLYSLNPIVQLARDASLLASFTSADGDQVKKKPFQRFVLDGVLPQYGTQSLDGPLQGGGGLQDDRSTLDNPNSNNSAEKAGSFDSPTVTEDDEKTTLQPVDEGKPAIGGENLFNGGSDDGKVGSGAESQKGMKNSNGETNKIGGNNLNEPGYFSVNSQKPGLDENFPSTVRVTSGYSFAPPKNQFDEGPTQFRVTTSYSVQDPFPTASPTAGTVGNVPFAIGQNILPNGPQDTTQSVFDQSQQTVNENQQRFLNNLLNNRTNPTESGFTFSSTNTQSPLSPSFPQNDKVGQNTKSAGPGYSWDESPDIDVRFDDQQYNNYMPKITAFNSLPVSNTLSPFQRNPGVDFFTPSNPDVSIPGNYISLVPPMQTYKTELNTKSNRGQLSNSNVGRDPLAVFNIKTDFGGAQFSPVSSSVTPSPYAGSPTPATGYNQYFTGGSFPTQVPTTTQSFQPSNPTLHYNRDIYGNVYLGPKPAFENSHIVLPMLPPPFGFFSTDPRLVKSHSKTNTPQAPQNPVTLSGIGANNRNENSNFTSNPKDLETIIGESLGLDGFQRTSPQFNQGSTTNSSTDAFSSFGINNSENSFVSITPSTEAFSESTTATPSAPTQSSTDSSIPNFTSTSGTIESSNPTTFGGSLENQNPTLYSTAQNPAPTFNNNNGFNSFYPTTFGFPTSTPFVNTQQYLPPQYYPTRLRDYTRVNWPLFQPSDPSSINKLVGSTEPSVFGRSSADIIKSIGFSFDTREGRAQFEKAISEGLFDR